MNSDLIRKFIPRWLIVTVRLQKIFFRDYGHCKKEMGMPVNGKGEFQPWLTYPLIQYLKGTDFSDKNVFEFGAGASTLFWSKIAKSVVSVEYDKGWYETLKKSLPSNVSLYHEDNGHQYADYPKTLGRKFDIIVVDGAERYRSAKTAIDSLNEGGMIILDNAEWYPNTADLLTQSGLIEIRFSGFSPENAFTSTSSIFMHRNCGFKRNELARLPPPGGKIVNAIDDVE